MKNVTFSDKIDVIKLPITLQDHIKEVTNPQNLVQIVDSNVYKKHQSMDGGFWKGNAPLLLICLLVAILFIFGLWYFCFRRSYKNTRKRILLGR